MFLMKNKFYFNLYLYYKKKKIITQKKEFLFKLIKNFYLLQKNYKNIIFFSPQVCLQMYIHNFYYLNLLTNLTTKKWFIHKMIS